MWGFDDLFWLTVLVIFLATIIGALVGRLRKDKCLKLLHDDHVTYLTGDGASLWGDLVVASQGLELRYDAPYETARGLVKSSFLVFPDDWATCTALCRTVHGLTEEERASRERQVRRSFAPGPLRRLMRSLRNFVNTIRDGITKTVGLFVGAMARRGEIGQAVAGRGGEVDTVGKSLVGMVANAYEPLLERHIGKPVVVEVKTPAGARCEFPGYLVDYTAAFVAVFNVEHPPVEKFEVTSSRGAAGVDGIDVQLEPGRVHITCTGTDALVVRRLERGKEALDLGVTLLPGCGLSLPRNPRRPWRIVAERTRQLDLVCPRARARVRFGSEVTEAHRPGWSGVAPEDDDAEPAAPQRKKQTRR